MPDEAWGWADGLPQARIRRIMGGLCSLATTLAFDIESEEAEIDAVIDRFESHLASLGVAVPV